MSEARFRDSALLALATTLVLLLVAAGIYFASPTLIEEKVSATSVQFSIEVSVGEIIGGLLVGSASMLAGVAYALGIGRSNPTNLGGNAPGGAPAPGAPPRAGEEADEQQKATMEAAVSAAANAAANAATAKSDEMLRAHEARLENLIAETEQRLAKIVADTQAQISLALASTQQQRKGGVGGEQFVFVQPRREDPIG